MKRSEAEKAEAMEAAALMERLDEWGFDERIDGSEIGSRHTSDGVVFVIKIDPWTAGLAEQITGVAEPTRVAVEPLTD